MELVKQRKVKIELDEDIVLKLGSMKTAIGETYSDVVRRLLG